MARYSADPSAPVIMPWRPWTPPSTPIQTIKETPDSVIRLRAQLTDEQRRAITHHSKDKSEDCTHCVAVHTSQDPTRDSNVTCVICYTPYYYSCEGDSTDFEEPMALPCGHIFGNKCLARQRQAGGNTVYNCAYCRFDMVFQDCGHLRRSLPAFRSDIRRPAFIKPEDVLSTYCFDCKLHDEFEKRREETNFQIDKWTDARRLLLSEPELQYFFSALADGKISYAGDGSNDPNPTWQNFHYFSLAMKDIWVDYSARGDLEVMKAAFPMSMAEEERESELLWERAYEYIDGGTISEGDCFQGWVTFDANFRTAVRATIGQANDLSHETIDKMNFVASKLEQLTADAQVNFRASAEADDIEWLRRKLEEAERQGSWELCDFEQFEEDGSVSITG